MRKYKLKKWVKVAITLIIILLGIIIHRYLYINGSLANENTISSMFILLGWFWLVFGQIMVLYVMWEN